MTVTTNGDARAAVYALLNSDPTLNRDQLSERLGGTPKARQCATYRADWLALRASAAPAATTTATLPAGPETPIERPIREDQPARSLTTPRPAARKRAPTPDVIDRWCRPVVTVALTGIALVVSYSHMRHLAELAGASWPMLIPLMVDGLMAAAVLCLRRHPAYWPARLGLAAGVIGALVLNGAAERPDLVSLPTVRLGMAIFVPLTAAFGVHLATKR